MKAAALAIGDIPGEGATVGCGLGRMPTGVGVAPTGVGVAPTDVGVAPTGVPVVVGSDEVLLPPQALKRATMTKRAMRLRARCKPFNRNNFPAMILNVTE